MVDSPAMDGALRKARILIGNGLVRAGLRILERPEEKAKPEIEELEEDMVGPFVRLSPEAEKMIQDGQRVEFHARPKEDTAPLVGSLQERMMQARARKEMGT